MDRDANAISVLRPRGRGGAIVIKASLKLLDWFCDISSLIILYVTVVVIFVQVICRYVLQVALPWTEEFARFAFIWLIFLANAMAERQKEHFRVSYFVEQAPRPVRYAFWILGEILIFVFFIWLLMDSLQFVKMGQRMISTVMQLRLDWVYWALPAAIVLGLLNRSRNIVAVFRQRPDNPFA
jgi:TRAP-type C4-dicarboxylate transport system permease small subunit